MSRPQRLYYDNPQLFQFDATVVGHAEYQGSASLLLNHSAFYPESGGQLADRGRIDGVELSDVQLDPDGQVHHLLDGPLPAIGQNVTAHIDRARRRSHMALHTGQHILSRALMEEAQADTVSARLGEKTCTIDIGRASIKDAVLARVESLSNAVIDDDLTVDAFFPSEQQLEQMALRRAAKLSQDIRVVQIGDFDLTPCGGTHCQRTAQVGLIHIVGVERYKKGLRINFTAGPRARKGLGQAHNVLRTLAQDLSCGMNDVPSALDKLRRNAKDHRQQLSELRERLGQALAHELTAQSSGHRVVALLEEAPLELVRAAAWAITRDPEGVALLAGKTDAGLAVVVTRGEQASFNCGEFLKRAAHAGHGRGGGRPDHAEGKFGPNVDWQKLVGELLAD